jgi:hypothetical protein
MPGRGSDNEARGYGCLTDVRSGLVSCLEHAVDHRIQFGLTTNRGDLALG